MVRIESVVFTQDFESSIKKMRHGGLKEKVKKQIAKIVANPDVGKPLRYALKGEWTVYARPYRIIYKVDGSVLILLRFEHREDVYR